MGTCWQNQPLRELIYPVKCLKPNKKLRGLLKKRRKEESKSRRKQRSQEIQSQKWGGKIVNKNLEEEVIRIQDEAKKAEVTKIKGKNQRSKEKIKKRKKKS